MINLCLAYILVFSILAIIRLVAIVIFSIFSTPAKHVKLTNTELIFYGMMLSYIITYVIYK